MSIPNITVYLVLNLKRKSLGVNLNINLCTVSTCQNEIDFHVVLFFIAKTWRGGGFWFRFNHDEEEETLGNWTLIHFVQRLITD